MSSLPMIGAHERVDGAGEVYRRLSDGKTFRLRTTNNPVLIAKVVDGANADARLPFETEDFAGVCIQSEPGYIESYLVPSNVAAKAMRKARQEWLDESGVHNPDNRARVVYFQRDPDNRNRAWFGFAEKWLKYKIGEHHLQALAKFEKEETPAAGVFCGFTLLRLRNGILDATRCNLLTDYLVEASIQPSMLLDIVVCPITPLHHEVRCSSLKSRLANRASRPWHIGQSVRSTFQLITDLPRSATERTAR